MEQQCAVIINVDMEYVTQGPPSVPFSQDRPQHFIFAGGDISWSLGDE